MLGCCSHALYYNVLVQVCYFIHAGGDVKVIKAVLASPHFRLSEVVDEKGQTPIHLVVKAQVKRKISSKVLEFLLQQKIIDPTIPDRTNTKSGKQPIDYLQQSDIRRPILEKALQDYHSQSATSSQKDCEDKKASSTKCATVKVVTGSSSKQPSNHMRKQRQSTSAQPGSVTEDSQQSPQEKLIVLLDKVLHKSADYFQEGIPEPVEQPPPAPAIHCLSSDSPKVLEHVSSNFVVGATESSATLETSPVEFDSSPAVLPTSMHEGEEDIHSQTSLFDGLTWEVEVTKDVLRFFEDKKHNSPELRRKVVTVIYQLAEGRRGDKLSKAVSKPSEDRGLLLYEARINKASRILWEKAIQFSARQTDTFDRPVYTQVVRVWSVVLDHDQLHHCIQKIKLSHQRGQSASNRLNLIPRKLLANTSTEPVRGRETLDIPITFEVGSSSSATKKEFIPAASLKEDEFNITTFYNFSTALVKSILIQENQRHFEFPFKEWPREHEIISLPFGAKAILLLGRSGTGKTTCCLYRLWNEFKLYWDPLIRHPDLRIPRKALVFLPLSEDVIPLEPEDSSSEYPGEDSNLTEAPGSPWPVTMSSMLASELSHSPEAERCEVTAELYVDAEPCDSVEMPPTSDEEKCGLCPRSDNETLEDDLHQVFITKNYVLCSQMNRRFYDMAAPYEFLDKHMEFENRKVPNSLHQITDLAYPLFLTAREFYILLDNSLMDGINNSFFPRDSEGNLTVKIVSTDYDHEDQDIPLDLESDSDDEDSVVADTLSSSVEVQAAPVDKAMSKYVEVTSLYFRDKVWNSISSSYTKGIDPVLAWMEIQSYIKGSEKALRKGSPLSLEEYQSIGGKAAANYVDHRNQVYSVFEEYQKYCQGQRHTTIHFDESDLILDLHQRICKLQDVPWSIHSFYVDEVQDFTQAELSLFVQCCRDPNSIFLTGDTAQSIMRGIAFRFEDVRSIFHRIHNCEHKVKVPESPYTLLVNFRSHSRVLGLAQSVLDLLFEYFKNSIDSHLPEDKGMLPGPTPVLLESCRVEDLAILLSANKRQKSAIEFGAHQVVLVRSKEARDKLPDILKGAIVLTVFESKGLEFDDVLLYNFFSDSEVRLSVLRCYFQVLRVAFLRFSLVHH